MKRLKVGLLIESTWEAEQVVDALIRYERSIRKKGFGPWSRLAHEIQVTRRKLQEDAGFVLSHKQVESLVRKPPTSGRSTPKGGRFFKGEISGTVCFVPDSCVIRGRLNAGRYIVQGWASFNRKANPSGFGSHLFPDLGKPLASVAVIPAPEWLLDRLEQLRKLPLKA
jgi:hypothetical protein